MRVANSSDFEKRIRPDTRSSPAEKKEKTTVNDGKHRRHMLGHALHRRRRPRRRREMN